MMKKSSGPKKSRRPKLPPWVAVLVWARAAGRCEFLGCNEPLWKDLLTTHEFNRGKLAHIIAARPDGPRGDPVESPRLAKEPTNIMLLCGPHHDLVDDLKLVQQYPVEKLRAWKVAHAKRIEQLTSIRETMKSVPVVLQVPIHVHADPLPVEDAPRAIASRLRYPDDERRIEINLLGMHSRDHDASFWAEARQTIRGLWESRVAALQAKGPIEHLSVFAVGPMPLLIDFGRHIGDKLDAEIFNLHRTPKGWTWPADRAPLQFTTRVPKVLPAKVRDVALALSLSGDVTAADTSSVLPMGTPLFELRTRNPLPDTLRHPEDLAVFGNHVRKVMERIHRAGAQRIHVFPGVPTAAAVQFGRSLLPKVHAPLVLYDHNRSAGGWREAFTIS